MEGIQLIIYGKLFNFHFNIKISTHFRIENIDWYFLHSGYIVAMYSTLTKLHIKRNSAKD